MKLAWVRAGAVICLCALAAGGSANAATDKTWFLWDVYKAHFMASDGRIVDWNSEERTTSEGEAYALFFALVANDRASFALILNWTQNNLAQGSLQDNLPSWLWKRTASGGWGVADTNSASDADLWMAYTLIQAGRLWQDPSYSTLGRMIAQHIADDEVVALQGSGLLLLPGRAGFRLGDTVFFANPSYEPLQLLAALGNEFPDGPWTSLIESEPDLVSEEVGHGFAMDWVRFKLGSGFSAVAGPSASGPGFGSYDAIRVYLWAGMLDPHAPGRDQLLNNLSGMRAYLEAHDVPPERVGADGIAEEGNAPVGFSAAVTPFLSALGDDVKSNAQLARLESQRVGSTGLYGPGQNYYDQNLALFARGWSEGFFRFDPQGQLQVRWKT
jgi:endo-1,4-beta-D-glucanase Y